MVTSDKKHCSDNEEKVISLNSLKNKMHHRGNCREILLDQIKSIAIIWRVGYTYIAQKFEDAPSRVFLLLKIHNVRYFKPAPSFRSLWLAYSHWIHDRSLQWGSAPLPVLVSCSISLHSSAFSCNLHSDLPRSPLPISCYEIIADFLIVFGVNNIVGSILMVWMGFLVMLITIQKIIDQIVFDTLIDYADAYSNL